jgi:hypothetical protein
VRYEASYVPGFKAAIPIAGPQLWRVNIGCLEGVDPYAPEASVANGVGLSVVEDA